MSMRKQQHNAARPKIRDADVHKQLLRVTRKSDDHHRLRPPSISTRDRSASPAINRRPRYFIDASTIVHPPAQEPGWFSAAAREHAERLRRASVEKQEALQAKRRALYDDVKTNDGDQRSVSPHKRAKRSHFAFGTSLSSTSQVASDKSFDIFDDKAVYDESQHDEDSDGEIYVAAQQQQDTQTTFLRSFLCWLCCSEDDSYSVANFANHSRMFRSSSSGRGRSSSETDAQNDRKTGDTPLRDSVSSTQELAPVAAAAAVNYGPSTTSLAQRNAQQKAAQRSNYQQLTANPLLRSDTIHEAARTADMDGLKLLLDMLPSNAHIRRQHINRPDETGTTPLHYAARYHHVQMARALISLGAHVNARGEFGQTALHAACRHRARVGRLYSKAAMNFLPSHWVAAELRQARKRRQQQQQQQEQQRNSQQNKEDKTAQPSKLRTSYSVEVVGRRSIVGGVVIQVNRQRAATNPPPLMSVIRLLCDAGADVNARDCFGNTPLHIAIMRGNSSAVRELLSMPTVNVNAVDETQSTPLHLASSHGALDIVQMLLKTSTNPDLRVRDTNSNTPLHLACAQGNFEVVCELLGEAQRQQQSSAVEVINTMLFDRNVTGQIPLGRAVEGGHVRVVHELIERGSPINAPNLALMTPLHIAAGRGDLEMCKTIVETTGLRALNDDEMGQDMLPYGVGRKNSNEPVLACKRSSRTSREAESMELPVTQPLFALLEARNMRQETPLHRATSLDRRDVVIYLVSKGVNFEARESTGWTPLLVAARHGHAELVRVLVEHGANPVVFSKRDRSALFLATLHNYAETVAMLLRYLSRQAVQELLSHSDRYGLYPIHVASQCGHVDVLRMLVEAGGVELVDERLYDEKTAMRSAAQCGRDDVVKYLAAKNDDLLRHEDEQGNTPLHLAAASGHFSTVTILIALLDAGEATFDANDRNAMHWTALDCAAARGHARVCRAILQAGAPLVPSKKLVLATTPLHLACAGGHLDTVQLLLEAHVRHKLSLAARDADGQNCLDLAIGHGHSEIAAVLVQSSRWRDVMRNEQIDSSSETGSYRETPLRKLIRTMPDVAYKALNICMQSNVGSRDFRLICDFEFIDDTFSQWVRSDTDEQPQTNFVGTSSYYAKDDPILNSGGSGYNLLTANRYTGSVFVRLACDGKPYTDNRLVLRNNHPLKLMVHYKREQLLTHPLVLAIIDQKWLMYGQYAFYFTFITYVMFLACFTAYCLQTVPINRLFWHTNRNVERRIFYAWWADDLCPPNTPWPLTGDVTQLNPEDVCRAIEQYVWVPAADSNDPLAVDKKQTIPIKSSAILDDNSSTCSMQFLNTRQQPPSSSFTYANQYILSILSVLLLIKELGQALIVGTAEDWLSLPVFALAFITSIPWRHDCLDRAGIKLSWEWQLMSFNIVLAYTRLVLLMRHFPWFGLYVQMLSDVAVSVLRFLPVGALVMLAFNFGLYVAMQGSARHLHTPDPLVDAKDDAKNINSFSVFYVGAFPKMMTMLVGEFEHQLHFLVTNQPIIQVIYGLYLVPTTTAILNMITGLSIQDLKTVREAAMLKRIAMRIDLSLAVERMTPMSVRARKFKMKSFVYPNRHEYTGETEDDAEAKPHENAGNASEQHEGDDGEAHHTGWWSRARAAGARAVAAAVGDTHADLMEYAAQQQQNLYSGIQGADNVAGTQESSLSKADEPSLAGEASRTAGTDESETPAVSEFEALINSIHNDDDGDDDLLAQVDSKLSTCKQTILQAVNAVETNADETSEAISKPHEPKPVTFYGDPSQFLFGRETDEDAVLAMEEPELIITNVDNRMHSAVSADERHNDSFLYESTRRDNAEYVGGSFESTAP